jgi:hypothetical protein
MARCRGLCIIAPLILPTVGALSMQPWPFTPYLQVTIAVSAFLIGVSALIASFGVLTTDKNARLVEIGVSVLRADPKKEPSALAARKWALDLIDANAGGVKFSPEARAALGEQALPGTGGYFGGGYDFGGMIDSAKGKGKNSN